MADEIDPVEKARAEQLADEATRYANLCAVMREAGSEQADWSYSPPRSDDWTKWCPVARYAAADLRYRQTGETWSLLKLGGGPFYCAVCSARPGDGWRPRLCLGCWWEDTGYDQALKAARMLGRAVGHDRRPRGADGEGGTMNAKRIEGGGRSPR